MIALKMLRDFAKKKSWCLSFFDQKMENELSRIAIRESIQVHSKLGPGLLESIYEECLCYRLVKSGLKVERQKPIAVVYDQIKMNAGFRCDILIEKKLLIEIKSVQDLNDVHFAQVLSYLKLADLKLGLLLNFNVYRLRDGIRRIVNGF